MAWIALQQGLTSDIRTMKLRRALGLRKNGIAETLGHLAMLRLWALENAPDGYLGDLAAADVAYAAGWEGNAAKFYEQLEHCGFIENNQILDRDEMEAKYAARKLNERNRKRKYREQAAREKRQAEENSRTVRDCPGDSMALSLENTHPTVPKPNLERRNNTTMILAAARSRESSRRSFEENCTKVLEEAFGDGEALFQMLKAAAQTDEQLTGAITYAKRRARQGKLKNPAAYMLELLADWSDRNIYTTEDIERNRRNAPCE